MKKLFLFGIGILALASCQQDETSIDKTVDAKGVTATISDFEDGNTRSTLTPDDKSVKFNWSEGDKLGVMAPDGSDKYRQQGLIMKSGEGGSPTANFVGSSFQLKPGVKYVAYYPGINDMYKTDALITEKYTGQVQTSNNSATHLVKADILASDPTEPTGLNQVNFRLKHLGAVMRVNISGLTAGATYTKLTVRSADQDFNATETYNLFTQERTELTTSTSLTLQLNNCAVATDGSLTLYLMLPPIDLSGNKALTFTLATSSNSNAEKFDVTINAKLQANKYYRVNLKPNEEPVVYTYTQPNDVDLPGLNVEWADRNLGAKSPTDYGYYFAWGETEPHKDNRYAWDTYKFYANNGYQKVNKYWRTRQTLWTGVCHANLKQSTHDT